MTRLTAAVLAMVAASSPAPAQVACLPPEVPFAYAPPEDDPELRALIDEEYQAYIRDTEAYLNAEGVRVRAEFDTLLRRYVTFFGIEAGVAHDAPD